MARYVALVDGKPGAYEAPRVKSFFRGCFPIGQLPLPRRKRLSNARRLSAFMA